MEHGRKEKSALYSRKSSTKPWMDKIYHARPTENPLLIVRDDIHSPIRTETSCPEPP
jgi:hypothetical protein